MTEPIIQAAPVEEAGLELPSPVVPRADALVFGVLGRRPDVSELPEPVFADDTWPMHHAHHADHLATHNVLFETVPLPFRHAVKVFMWNLLNTPAQRASSKMRRARVSPTSALIVFYQLRALAKWATDRRLTSFAQITSRTWKDYADYVADREVGYEQRAAAFTWLCRVWVHNVGLGGDLALAMPPWFDRDLDHWLGARPYTHENRTEPVPADVIADVVHACIELVEDYLEGRLSLGSRGVRWEARAWAIAQGMRVPSGKGRSVTPEQLEAFRQASGHVPRFDVGDIRTAAMILVGYLTGMRPQEVLHLERGCLKRTPAPVDSQGSGATRFKILGRTFKNVLDEDGVADTSGAQRLQPWVTIEPAARAIEALERLALDDTYLFALTRRHQKGRQRRGRVVTIQVANDAIERLLTKWNLHAARGDRRPIRLQQPVNGTEAVTGDQSVPVTDPSEESNADVPVQDDEQTRSLSLAQLRRTLAWHIANQPGGEVALGVQYGHMHGIVSLGYAGRAESGFPDEVELDRLFANWDTLQDLSESLNEGSAVSGPAKDRLADGITEFDHEFGGKVRTEAELRRLQRSGLSLIYNNPHASVVCVYSAATAACQTDRPEDDERVRTPDLSNCRRTCPNIALLDRHAAAKRDQAAALQAEAVDLPLPLADRNRFIAAQLLRQVDAHTSSGASPDDGADG